MKTRANSRSFPCLHPRGFALIVTLSLMILLTVIAVGLLSLSSISLRASSQGNAMAIARANARLALMLAIGDLQTAAGPDKRVTAPGGVLSETAEQQRITGVWKSRKLGPQSTADDFSESTKNTEFVRWLVSGDYTDQTNVGYAQTSPGTGKTVVDLVSAANLDPGAPVVKAKKVAIKGSGANSSVTTGHYAYAVLDEGVKARVNLGFSPAPTDFAGSSTALGGGQRPPLDSITGIGTLAAESVNLSKETGRSLTSKMISLPTAEFAYGQKGKMIAKLHDLTANSQGVLVDVANGGLKKDFNLLSEETERSGIPPAEFAGVGIYKQSFNATIASDPSWARSIAWSRIFGKKSSALLSKRTVGGTSVPTLTASVPALTPRGPTEWIAGTGKNSNGTNAASATLSFVEPSGPVLLPSIAKIQMSFALAARDVYDYGIGKSPVTDSTGRKAPLRGEQSTARDLQTDVGTGQLVASPYNYLLHMVYSPIVTLHNPYSTPIRFIDLRVEFVNVPFAFQVFKTDENGTRPQTTEPVPFSVMYNKNGAASSGESKRFGLTLTDTLLPGEVKVFSPEIPPSRTWFAEAGSESTTVGGKTVKRVFWDYGNANAEDGRAGATETDTSRGLGIPGWNGVKVGYDLESIATNTFQSYTHETIGNVRIKRAGKILLKNGDRIFVESTPLQDPQLTEKKFSVEMTLNHTSGKLTRSSVLVFEFNDNSDLQESMMAKNPQAKDLKIRAPRGTDMWETERLFDHATKPLNDMGNTQPFALFSAYAKTTSSGNDTDDPDGYEGLWAAKPFSFQNHGSVAISQTVTRDNRMGHPSHFSHELALSEFPEKGLNVQATTGRGNFITSHLDATKSLRFGSLYEVPLAPLQNFSTLNGSQLAASPYLPHFSAPVGNSHAHPLMSGLSALEPGPAGYDHADHSFLLNSALYDSYYFSGLQTRAAITINGDGKTLGQLVNSFLDSSDPKQQVQSPLTDQRLKPYYSDGSLRTEVVQALNDPGAYKKAAAFQVIEGAFNVNSISEDAWKAVLSSMTGEGAQVLLTPFSANATTTISKIGLTKNPDANGARFSRFRIPNGQSQRTTRDGYWRGPIDLTEAEVKSLATEIVKQVRERGPFLSMAEFVNRQLGPAEEKTLAGALQTAIDKSGVNNPATSASNGNFKIGSDKTSGLAMKNPKALEGDSTQGAPGYLMQSDILSVLGNTATVRSDTFKIRSYGETVDKAGNVIARAYCEAIVQRSPEFVDPQDNAFQDVNALASTANQTFGRRFSILSVRWLSPSEI